jgi:putative membrane protein
MNFLVKLLVNSIAVIIGSYLLSGVHVQDPIYAVIVAAVLSILNVSVKPLLLLFTLPFTIFTLGLFVLVINASIIMIADWLIPAGFEVDGFWWALLFSLLLSLLNSILESLVKKDNNPGGNGGSRLREPEEGEIQVFDKDGNRIK